MLFEQKDWKEHLAKEDEEKLNELLKRVLAYRESYSGAADVRAAQLWCAMLELRKESEAVNQRVERIERILETLLSFSAKEPVAKESLKQEQKQEPKQETKELRESLGTF